MTTMMDPATDGTVALAADLTIRQHRSDGTSWAPGSCRQCRPDGTCPQMVWALSERQRIREQAAARIARIECTSHRMSGGNPTAGAAEGERP